MIRSLFNITVIAEWVALLVGVKTLVNSRNQWRWFILFLVVTIFTETLGWYLRTIKQTPHFKLPFNILLMIRVCFFLWIFSLSELLSRFRKSIIAVILVFLAFGLINLVFIQGFWIYNFYTEVIGDILLVILCGLFYYELLMERSFRKLLAYPYFWLSVGLLLSALGSIVLYIFMESILAYYQETRINIGGQINTILSVILYGALIIAFICQRRQNLSLESS